MYFRVEFSFLSHISRGAVQFTSNGVLLHLPKSKTDQFRQGKNIAISPANDAACPVAALQLLFQKYPRSDTEPLFSRTLGPFNKQWIAEKLTSTLLKAGHDPTTYSGHSFRRGAANSAIAAGIPIDDVKKMGRWKSNAVEKYLTQASADTLLFAANKRLQLAPSNSQNTLLTTPPQQPWFLSSARGRS